MPEIKADSTNNVVRRDDQFADKTATKIWNEKPSKTNPYIAESASCHGYDLVELCTKRSFVDVLFLLFRNELPTSVEASLLEKLLIVFINPGPRHPATRAAMNAGVGNTDSSHILPIGLTVLGGSVLGAAEVENCMRWLRKSSRRDPRIIAKGLLENNLAGEGVGCLAPGFGRHFGSVDEYVQNLVTVFSAADGTGRIFEWSTFFVEELRRANYGWLSTGLAAAILCDLGFQPRMGPGIYQIMSAPGIFAQGIEMANKPMTAMPFLDDKDYIIETKKEKNIKMEVTE